MDTQRGSSVPKLSTGNNQVVMTGKCVLLRIIVGTDVGSSVIAVGDSATTTTDDIRLRLTSSTLKGVYECNMQFEKGITVSQTNQTDVTYVVAPTN